MRGGRLTLVAALTVSCIAPERDGAPTATVRDSAGIRIIDHGGVDYATLPQWQLEPAAQLSIGTVDGDAQHRFTRIIDVLRLRDGSVAVLDYVPREIRLFDGDGRHLRTFGGLGDGPGEFRGPSDLAQVRGDSVVVSDYGRRRLTVISHDGSGHRTARIMGFEGTPRLLGAVGEDRLMMVDHGIEVQNGTRTQFMVSHVLDLNGQATSSFGRQDRVLERWIGGAFLADLFSTPAVVGVAEMGLWFGSADEYEVRLVNGSASVAAIVRWTGPTRAVTSMDVGSYIDWEVARAAPDQRQLLREYLERSPVPDHFPAYERLIVDRSGSLWLSDFVREHSDDGLVRWIVISPDGTRILGRLTHRVEFEPHDAGEDWVLGVERDGFDVEYVRLYRLVKGTD